MNLATRLQKMEHEDCASKDEDKLNCVCLWCSFHVVSSIHKQYLRSNLKFFTKSYQLLLHVI